MDVYDLCIIGAGMFGSAAARHATLLSSACVCLIGPNEPTEEEKEHREIYGSYYDEGRIVYASDSDHAFRVLSKYTIIRFRDIEKLSGKKFYNPVGVLHIFQKLETQDDMADKLHSSTASLSNLTNNYSLNFPFLSLDGSYFIGFENNGAGHISARTYVTAQRKVAQMQGCDFIKDIVKEVKESVDGIYEVVTQETRVIKAKRILFCTGAFTVFKKLYPAHKLKITVHKETVSKLRISKTEAERLSSMPSILYFKTIDELPSTIHGAYILSPILYPNGEYYLKIGPIGNINYPKLKTLQDAKEWYHDRGDPTLLKALPKVLGDIIPNLKIEEETSDTCLTCTSPSGLPYIDKLSPNITVAIVGNGSGATISDEVGRIAAHLSLTGEWDSELSKELFQAAFKMND